MLLLLGGFGYLGYRYYRAEALYQAAAEDYRRRDFPEARALLETYLEDHPDSTRAHFLLARVARQSGLPLLAEQQLGACQAVEGPTERIALERMLLQVQQGGITAGTEAQLRRYLQEGHPESVAILEALSVGCLSSYRFGAGRAYLSAWLERDPDDFQAYLWRSVAAERLLDVGAARDDARRAVALAPRNPDARLRLAETLLLTTEAEEAAAVFESLHQEQPDNPVVALGLAKALAKLGRTEPAEKLLENLVARYPGDPPVLLERGRLEVQKGQAAAAEGWLREAAHRAPFDYQINYSLLLCLKQLGKEADARKVQEQLNRVTADGDRFRDLTHRLQQYPYDLSARCEIARIYLDEGQGREAVLWLQSALKIDRNYRPANQLLADYYDKSGEPDRAAPYRRLAGSPGTAEALGPGGAVPKDLDPGVVAPLPNP